MDGRSLRWALGSSVAAALLGLGFFAHELGNLRSRRTLGADSPLARQAAVARMVAESTGLFDAHPDPDVGRLLLPGLRDKTYVDQPVSTNGLGLREGPIPMPKPPGVTRVVLLGDSFVFGYGVPAEARLGVHLESYLNQRGRNAKGRVEVLHIGVVSWNLIAEAAFLRRFLTPLDPDLVIQIAVPNDLDDQGGVRGFGAQSTFGTRSRGRADARVHLAHSVAHWGTTNALGDGLGWESRSRLAEAAAAVGRLAREVERIDARYLMVGYWAGNNPVLDAALAPELAPRQRALISGAFGADAELHVSATDPHWNAEGHRRVARFLYALIHQRGLLPELDLAPWAEVDEEWGREVARVVAEAGSPRPQASELAAELDFSDLDARGGRQVLGGVDAAGRAGPYASLLLRRGGDRLRLVGRGLARDELANLEVVVRVDEVELGRLRPLPGRAFDHTFDLPEQLRGREAVSVILIASDYAYALEDGRRCVSMDLERVDLDP